MRDTKNIMFFSLQLFDGVIPNMAMMAEGSMGALRVQEKVLNIDCQNLSQMGPMLGLNLKFWSWSFNFNTTVLSTLLSSVTMFSLLALRSYCHWRCIIVGMWKINEKTWNNIKWHWYISINTRVCCLLTWCGTSSSYPLVDPVAQQAMETMAELGSESSAERSWVSK